MITTDKVWFAPINVLYHYARLESIVSPQENEKSAFKKATEAYNVAIMLMGIIKYQKRQYWLQVTKDEEGTPDIRTGTFVIRKGQPKELAIQEVEVIEFGQHSQDYIVDFLKRTKLSSKRAYPSTTTILCKVSKTVQLPPYKKIYNDLRTVAVKTPVIILGKIHPSKHIYRICQVHPNIDLLVDFDVMEESYNKKYRGVLRLEKGANDSLNFIYVPNEKHYPFELLGYKG